MFDKIRGFEILPEFQKRADEIIQANEELGSILPRRGTSKSSGYDIRSIETVYCGAHQVTMIPTGITAYMQDDEELQLRMRSGLGKRGIMLANGVGTIDSDYYGNHIMLLVYNSTDADFIISAGDRVAQGIFSKYLLADNDSPVKDQRTGGFGSTGIR